MSSRPVEEAAPTTDSGPELSTAVRGVIGAFQRRFWTFVTIAAVLFVAVVAGTMLLRPEYLAQSRIKIDPTRNAATGLQADRTSSTADTAAVDTEVTVIKSRDLARAVVRDLRLYSNETMTLGLPAVQGPLRGAELEERIDTVAGRLVSKLKAERETNTYVVQIGFQSPDPRLAAQVANAVADHYINNSVGVRTGTASQQTKMLEQRLEQLGSEVRAIDAQIAQGRATAGIVEGGTLGTITDQQVGPLATQLATAESAAAAARSSLSAAQAQIRSGKLENVSGVLNSPVVADLRRQRAEVVRNMGEVQARYGPRHPESVRVGQQLESIDNQIGEEARRITDSLRSEAASADARAASLRSTLSRLRSEQASNTRASVTVGSLEREAETKRTAYNQLAASVQQASQIKDNSLAQATVIEQATPPSSPSYPKKGLLIAAGLILSLIVAAAVIGIQELLTPGYRTATEVENRLGIPLLAAVPKLVRADLKGMHNRKLTADILLTKPASFYAEAFRTIRSSILLAPGQQPKVIAMVSTLPGEGKTTSAVSLARVMALAGERVLLIDGDLRRGGVRAYVSNPPAIGLGEVLSGQANVEDAIIHDAIGNLDLITVAKPLFSAADMFSGERMQQLLTRWRGQYDRIIIDTPPVLGVADARVLAKLADTVLLIIRWNKTPSSAVSSALGALQMDNANVGGAVFAIVDRSAEAAGGHYYSRKYAPYYEG